MALGYEKNWSAAIRKATRAALKKAAPDWTDKDIATLEELQEPDSITALELSLEELQEPDSITALELSLEELQELDSITALELSPEELQELDSITALELSPEELQELDSIATLELSLDELRAGHERLRKEMGKASSSTPRQSTK